MALPGRPPWAIGISFHAKAGLWQGSIKVRAWSEKLFNLASCWFPVGECSRSRSLDS